MIKIFKEFMSEHKEKVIIIIVLFIFAFIMIIVNNSGNNKIIKQSKYVYTMESNNIDGFTSKLPYINIDSEDIDTINKEIMTKYYTEKILGEKYADYEYYKNKNIISLIVKYQYIEAETDLSLEMDFFNIDINTGKLLSNSELLDIYNVDNNYVEDKISQNFKEYYKYEKENNYIVDCDFNCYKETIENSFLGETNFYVKNDDLYAYRAFQTGRDFAIDGNKPFELFRFKIS